jgi:ABC-type sugar transport system, permease component
MKNKSTGIAKTVINNIILLGFGFIVIFPLIWMVSTSLKTSGALDKIPPEIIPSHITFDNYTGIWLNGGFPRYTVNSLFIAVMDVFGTVISACIVAFGLAMFEFKGRKLIYMCMLATLMMPFQVTVIPQFFFWTQLHAIDTYLPLILPSFLGSAFGIFLMHQHYKSIPKELFEAGIMDGCNPLRIIFKIYIPLSKPSIAALAVFTFIGVWNSTLGPILYLKSKDLYTLTLGLLYLNADSNNIDKATVMAGATITTIPAVAVFLFAQKYFIQGIATAGLKG